MDFAKQLAPDTSTLLTARRSAVFRNERGEYVAVCVGNIPEFVQRGGAVIRQSITPFFCLSKQCLFHATVLAEPVKGVTNRLGINVSHDLADKLLLSAQRTVRAGRLCDANLFHQVVVGVNRVKLILREGHQAFAQGL